MQVYVDGTAGTATLNSGGYASYPDISFGLASAGGSYMTGALAEIVSYNRLLTTAERQQVEVFLKAKHGTP